MWYHIGIGRKFAAQDHVLRPQEEGFPRAARQEPRSLRHQAHPDGRRARRRQAPRQHLGPQVLAPRARARQPAALTAALPSAATSARVRRPAAPARP